MIEVAGLLFLILAALFLWGVAPYLLAVTLEHLAVLAIVATNFRAIFGPGIRGAASRMSALCDRSPWLARIDSLTTRH
jgi:hypothetical protein